MSRTSLRCSILFSAVALVLFGCDKPARTVAHLSGTVTFKGQPVPEGFINFIPEITGGNTGEVKAFEIKDGVYNTEQGGSPGIYPGANKIMISGFDGKGKKLWPKGVQIFNPIEENLAVAAGTNKKDFVVPESAGQNVKIVPTADP